MRLGVQKNLQVVVKETVMQWVVAASVHFLLVKIVVGEGLGAC